MSGQHPTFNRSLWRRRSFHERLAHHGIAFGGTGVIIAVVLIFFYPVYVVMPVFQRTSLEPVTDYRVTEPPADTLWVALEEQDTLAVRNLVDGRVQFFAILDGTVQAAQVSGYTAFMYLGNLVGFGDTNTIFTTPKMKQTEDYITGRYC